MIELFFFIKFDYNDFLDNASLSIYTLNLNERYIWIFFSFLELKSSTILLLL